MKYFYLSIIFVLNFTLLGESDVSNAELSRKLDLILGKVGGLEERVGKLESENTEVKNDVKAVTKTANEAKAASKSWNSLQRKRKNNLFSINSKTKSTLRKPKIRDHGPKKRVWSDVRNNLTRFQIRKKLGDPHEVKSILNPELIKSIFTVVI